ncbi:MAG: hypothetical protein AABX51_03610 [Nanoarchaeota archaeon]
MRVAFNPSFRVVGLWIAITVSLFVPASILVIIVTNNAVISLICLLFISIATYYLTKNIFFVMNSAKNAEAKIKKVLKSLEIKYKLDEDTFTIGNSDFKVKLTKTGPFTLMVFPKKSLLVKENYFKTVILKYQRF